jgi:hypothetical protein
VALALLSHRESTANILTLLCVRWMVDYVRLRVNVPVFGNVPTAISASVLMRTQKLLARRRLLASGLRYAPMLLSAINSGEIRATINSDVTIRLTRAANSTKEL